MLEKGDQIVVQVEDVKLFGVPGGVNRQSGRRTPCAEYSSYKEAISVTAMRQAVFEMLANEVSAEPCRNCHGQSRPVSRKTLVLMLKPELLEQAMTGTYSFCSTLDCPVVYFDDQRRDSFTIDDLRVAVGVKATKDPIALCYCFGFDESHIREEISSTGRTTVPERISRLIREGLCACDSRNPAGVCCLGEVNRAAKRLTPSLR